MAKYRHLANAPITEAIIDFRVKLSSKFRVAEFSSLKEVLLDSYPNVEERRLIAGGIKVVAGKQIEQTIEDKGRHGYFFRSHDGRNVAQFRRDGFTFSRLKPYMHWEDILAEAKDLWQLYVAKASPELVTRIAVRYINQLNIPLPINDFTRYLTAPPNIPDTIPQAVHHFLTRVVVHDADLDTMANITQALQKSSSPDYVTIILDIDVYKQKELGFDESDIWLTFGQLHDLKNRIFFDSITEETARLYE